MKIEKGYYEYQHNGVAYTVYQQRNRVYYTRILTNKNSQGNMQSACSRVDIYWCYNVGGISTVGYGTKKSAMLAAKERIDTTKGA